MLTYLNIWEEQKINVTLGNFLRIFKIKTMFVKTKFTGASMIKYSVASAIIKIGLIVLFIVSSISNGTAIIDHIQEVVNSGIDLDLYFILKQVGIVILKFILAVVLEAIIIFTFIFPMAKREIEKHSW